MIFINNSADYSDASIGTVEVPFYDADATAIMAKFTKQIDIKQQYAFARLIDKLKTANLMGSIQSLVIPLFGANGAEASKDVIRDVSSSYNASTMPYFKLGKYGMYLDASEITTDVKEKCILATGYSGTNGATLCSLSFQKMKHSLPIVTSSAFFNSASKTTGGTALINVDGFPMDDMVIGKNVAIAAASTPRVTADTTCYCMLNGTYYQRAYTDSQKEQGGYLAANNMGLNIFSSGDLTNETFRNNCGMTSLVILFKKMLTQDEATLVSNALSRFGSSFYENDIADQSEIYPF